MRRAFTMIEVIFVIVILGILAGVAIPRLAATRDDASLATMRANVASIQTAISTQHGTDIIAGKNSYDDINFGDDANLSALMTKPVMVEKACGHKAGFCEGKNNSVTVCINKDNCAKFTFYPKKSGNIKAGTFTCDTTDTICKKILG